MKLYLLLHESLIIDTYFLIDSMTEPPHENLNPTNFMVSVGGWGWGGGVNDTLYILHNFENLLKMSL